MKMRDIINLTTCLMEAITPFTKWERWWANPNTDALLPVPSGGQHEDYLMEHLDEFFDSATIDSLLNGDEALTAAYTHGWYTILYDNSQHDLMIRGSDNRLSIRKIASKIANEHPVSALYVDVMVNGGLQHFEVSDDSLEVFLKNGRLKLRR